MEVVGAREEELEVREEERRMDVWWYWWWRWLVAE